MIKISEIDAIHELMCLLTKVLPEGVGVGFVRDWHVVWSCAPDTFAFQKLNAGDPVSKEGVVAQAITHRTAISGLVPAKVYGLPLVVNAVPVFSDAGDEVVGALAFIQVKRSSVLVVDDSILVRLRIRQTLENNDIHVIGEAKNGADAVIMCKKYHPAIVTMDITMPDMDGLTALREIRKTDEGCKVIMVSAMGQEKLVLEALSLGASNFIVKPFTDDVLLSAVSACFQEE
jgi:two-component system chemotaxis response regulator CheY